MSTWTYGQMPTIMGDVAQQQGLPADYLPFLEASSWLESGWNPNSVNPNDAGGPSEGLEQLHAPGGELTGSGLSYDQALNPILNLEVAYSNIAGQYRNNPSNPPAVNIGLAENPGNPNYASTLENIASQAPWATQLNMNYNVPPAPTTPPPGQPTPNSNLAQPYVQQALDLLNQVNGQGGGSTNASAFQGLTNAQLASYATGVSNTSNQQPSTEYVYSLNTNDLPVAWSICIQIQKYLNYVNYQNTVQAPIVSQGGLTGGISTSIDSMSRTFVNNAIQWGFRVGLAVGFGVMGWLAVNTLLKSVGTSIPKPNIIGGLATVGTISNQRSRNALQSRAQKNQEKYRENQEFLALQKMSLDNAKLQHSRQKEANISTRHNEAIRHKNARSASDVIREMNNAGYSQASITRRLKEMGLR